ncbi:MAG: aspartyl protease family protein [Kofleriaceae bacterium]
MKYGLIAAALLAGCSVGAPPGFSSGESWQAPLIGPLEDGLLIVPVFINGKGPYQFAVDGDANVTIVTQHVVNDAKLRIGQGPKMDDEGDHQRERFYAETLGLEVGTLVVERLTTEVIGDHAFDQDGRTIDGVIGRDVIADSLAWSFDRDQGTLTIMTADAYAKAAPAFGGTQLDWHNVTAQILARVQPVPRRLVTASIDGQQMTVHLDFGATTSQLRQRDWDKAQLQQQPMHVVETDEAGVPHQSELVGIASQVAVGPIQTKNVVFMPYDDKRWHDEDFEGSLGLDFFRDVSMLINWDKHTVMVKPRSDIASTATARLGRWQQSMLPKCEHTGCVTISIMDPTQGKAVEHHPGVIVSAHRDAASQNVALEALVAVQSPTTPGLQWLVINLPAKVDRAMTHLPAAYADAKVTVVDVSPFPRLCNDINDSCIQQIHAPGAMPEQSGPPGATVAPPATPDAAPPGETPPTTPTN